MTEKLPDALAKALGRVVADLQRDWERDKDRISAEARATIAELKADIVTLKGELADSYRKAQENILLACAGLKSGEPGKDGRDGKDVEPELLRGMVTEEVARVVSALPPAKDGEPGKQGDAGKDYDPDVLALAVAEAVKALPRPKDGASVTIEDVAPLLKQMVESAVSKIPLAKDGKDGAGIVGALIDRDGKLVLTLTDGATRDLGRVVGRDGADGKNGQDGAAGLNGMGFDDLTVEHDGERGFVFRLMQGERRKEFTVTIPSVLDRGVYKADQTYQHGDAVTYGGSLWIAQGETKGKPGEAGSQGWRLAVKRGRDGKDKA